MTDSKGKVRVESQKLREAKEEEKQEVVRRLVAKVRDLIAITAVNQGTERVNALTNQCMMLRCHLPRPLLRRVQPLLRNVHGFRKCELFKNQLRNASN